MAKIGRNDLCACASGKKYKKCCLPKEDAVIAARLRADAEQRAKAALEGAAILESARHRAHEREASAIRQWLLEDDLEEVSNSVVDLIDERRFEEALVVCERLLRDYSDVHDGLERSAMVHEALGNHALAADFYRKTLAFIEQPHLRDGYDPEVFDFFREKIATTEALARDVITHDKQLEPIPVK